MRHRTLRRICSLGLLVLLCAAEAVVLPVTAIAGGVPGDRRRAARFAAFSGTYLAAEIAGLFGARRLRASDQDAHYALLTRVLSRLFRSAQRAFGLRVVPPAQGVDLPDGPLLVFSRHAGPGDSFLLVYALLAVARRRPRIVLKDTLKFDPLIDVLLSRTPNCFVGRGEDAKCAATRCIATLAASLGPRDALLLFPEGRNFTQARRTRLIHRLHRLRRWRELPNAERLNHVLPAQPSGVFAAIDAAPPDATVLFVAHAGLGRLQTARDVWRGIPLDRPVQLAWWSTPVAEVPAGDHPRATWLEQSWARVDLWIGDRDDRPS